MTRLKPDCILLLLLRVGAFGCFVGWAWVHLYWEAPYGVLIWRDSTFEMAERLGIGWSEFVGSGANDGFVQQWLGRIGWLYLICAVFALTAREKSKFQFVGLIGGSVLLVILSYAKYVSSKGQLPMFIEHGGQMLIPVILVLALAKGIRHRATIITSLVAVIMIFAGHGAYALGYPWPTPANFLGMTSVILGVESEVALVIMRIAGILDLAVCVGLFIRPLRVISALYAAIWGFLTALARPVAGMSFDLNYWGADQYLHETVLRAPHFILPLYLFFLWRVSSPTDRLDNSDASHSDESTPLPSY